MYLGSFTKSERNESSLTLAIVAKLRSFFVIFCVLLVVSVLYLSFSSNAYNPTKINTLINGDNGIGGFYTDPNHYSHDKLSFAGTRMISDFDDEIVLIGTDDGEEYWSLKGKYVDESAGQFVIDFSPKGGPSDLEGVYQNGLITWSDGNVWTKSTMKEL